MDVKDVIRQFIHTELLYKKENIRLDDTTQLLDTGILDSLGIMKLLPFLEETFSIRVNEEELIPENFECIDTISRLIVKKIKSS